jgi:hypothetical protein
VGAEAVKVPEAISVRGLGQGVFAGLEVGPGGHVAAQDTALGEVRGSVHDLVLTPRRVAWYRLERGARTRLTHGCTVRSPGDPGHPFEVTVFADGTVE